MKFYPLYNNIGFSDRFLLRRPSPGIPCAGGSERRESEVKRWENRQMWNVWRWRGWSVLFMTHVAGKEARKSSSHRCCGLICDVICGRHSRINLIMADVFQQQQKRSLFSKMARWGNVEKFAGFLPAFRKKVGFIFPIGKQCHSIWWFMNLFACAVLEICSPKGNATDVYTKLWKPGWGWNWSFLKKLFAFAAT